MAAMPAGRRFPIPSGMPLPLASRAVLCALMLTVLTFAVACTKTDTVPSPTAGANPATLQVPVAVKGATALGALQLELSYDGAAYEFQSADAGPLAPGALLEIGRGTPGLVRLALVSGPGISGDGVVGQLTFRAKAQSGPSDISVGSLEAVDTELRDLVVTTSPGRMTANGQVTGLLLEFQK